MGLFYVKFACMCACAPIHFSWVELDKTLHRWQTCLFSHSFPWSVIKRSNGFVEAVCLAFRFAWLPVVPSSSSVVSVCQLASSRLVIIVPGTIFAAFCLEIRVSGRLTVTLSFLRSHLLREAREAVAFCPRAPYLSLLTLSMSCPSPLCSSSLLSSSRVHCQFVICLDQERISVCAFACTCLFLCATLLEQSSSPVSVEHWDIEEDISVNQATIHTIPPPSWLLRSSSHHQSLDLQWAVVSR